MPPVQLSEFSLTLVVFLMATGGGIIGWVLHAAHVTHSHLRDHERRPYIAIAGLVALGLVITTDADTPVYLGSADKMLAERTTPSMTIHQALEQCPPPAPDMTSQVIFTVETESDLEPRITGCTRIAQRGYLADNLKKGTQ